MARRVYDDYVGLVQERLGNRDDATVDRLEWWLNDAVKLAALTFMHPQLQLVSDYTLTAVTDTVTPTNFWWPDALKELTNGRVLWPDDKENIERILTKPVTPPSRFYWWGGVFTFDSKPSADVTIRIWHIKKPAYWTSGLPVLDEEYDPIIEGYAAMLGFKHFRDLENMQAEKKMTDNHAGQMKLPLREAAKLDYQSRVRAGGLRFGGYR